MMKMINRLDSVKPNSYINSSNGIISVQLIGQSNTDISHDVSRPQGEIKVE